MNDRNYNQYSNPPYCIVCGAYSDETVDAVEFGDRKIDFSKIGGGRFCSAQCAQRFADTFLVNADWSNNLQEPEN